MQEVQTTQKDGNYVSAVAYVNNDAANIAAFLRKINSAMGAKFKNYEIVMVNDASADDSEQEIKNVVKATNAPVTLITMSIYQGRELCMNAGIDAAIGDFLFEFDTLDSEFDEGLISSAYDTVLRGFDIVSVCPLKNRSIFSDAFYVVFNASTRAQYKLHTDVFRVLSRRAVNRVHAVSATPIYRKAAYAASGLKMDTIRHKSVKLGEKRHADMRVSLAADSLALYTNSAYKASFIVAVAMLFAMMLVLFYIFAVYFGANRPVEGWTTIMLVLTGGFFGVFAILTIILKYLSLLVNIIVNQQKYLVERVEKL